MNVVSKPLTSDRLAVPGAHIYYEIRGSGPMLLMIPGGVADAGAFAPIAEVLADRYTVVTYDPRGNSRSTFDGPVQAQRLDVHGDDARGLIETLGEGPAFVFGNSGGALIGLNLTQRCPELVRTLVAHEPPCIGLLSDAPAQRAFLDDVVETCVKSGVGPAWAKFLAGTGMERESPSAAAAQPQMSPEMLATFARIGGNLEYFIMDGMRTLTGYVPDVAALRAGSARVVVGVGETTIGETANRAGIALAEQLGIAQVTFPGSHVGFVEQVSAFADVIHRELAAE